MTDLPPAFWIGADQFNQGQFYACHDTFEAIWMETLDDRTFYQGLLQIAVALYHLSHHNWQGATTLLGEGIGRLRPYLPDHEGIDVAGVRSQAQAILTRLHHDGKPRVAQSAAAVTGLMDIRPLSTRDLPTRDLSISDLPIGAVAVQDPAETLPLPKIRKVAES